MSSRIEQIIDEIEEYIDNCKFQPLSTTKMSQFSGLSAWLRIIR